MDSRISLYNAYRVILIINTAFFLFTVVVYFFIQGHVVFSGSGADVSVNMNITIPSSAPPTQPEEETTGVPGAVPKLPIIQPGTAEKIFVRPEEGFVPYVVVGLLSRREAPPDELSWTYERNPVFFGKTNIKHATIFLQYRDFPEIIFTTFADDLGRWQMQPGEYLNFGWHEISVLAMSPLNAGIRAETHFLFQVLPLPSKMNQNPNFPALEEEGAPDSNRLLVSERPFVRQRISPSLSIGEEKSGESAQQEISLARRHHLFNVSVAVSEDTKEVFAFDEVEIEIRFFRFQRDFESEAPLKMRFFVIGPEGDVLYQSERFIVVDPERVLQTTLLISPRARIGTYRVKAELIDRDTIFVSSDTFVVRDRVLMSLPALTLTTTQVAYLTLRLSFFLLFIIFTCALLLWREYLHCKNVRQIDEKDLFEDRDIL